MKPVQSKTSSKLQTRPGSQTLRAYSQPVCGLRALAPTPLDPTHQETSSALGLSKFRAVRAPSLIPTPPGLHSQECIQTAAEGRESQSGGERTSQGPSPATIGSHQVAPSQTKLPSTANQAAGPGLACFLQNSNSYTGWLWHIDCQLQAGYDLIHLSPMRQAGQMEPCKHEVFKSFSE